MEPSDIARFTREIKAMGKAGSWDCESFAQLVALTAQLDEEVRKAAQALNGQGFSWAEIAQPLHLTRAAAHKRYAAS